YPRAGAGGSRVDREQSRSNPWRHTAIPLVPPESDGRRLRDRRLCRRHHSENRNSHWHVGKKLSKGRANRASILFFGRCLAECIRFARHKRRPTNLSVATLVSQIVGTSQRSERSKLR